MTGVAPRVIVPFYIDRGRLYELNGVKKYYFMCSRSRDNKCTCIYSSAGSNLLSYVHIMTQISVLYFIIHVCATQEALVASINRTNLGVLLLTVRTRHFPLSY